LRNFIIDVSECNFNKAFLPRAHLTEIALISFIFSFFVARLFTTFFPSIVLVAIGGWLGISYDEKEIDRVAAILYGVGGLIVDEVGLLLTFDNYWTSLTYSFLIIFLAFIIVLIFFFRYRLTVLEALAEFATNKVSLYLGIFLAAVSSAFIIQTDNFLVTVVAIVFAIIAVILILVFLLQRLKIIPKRHVCNENFEGI